MKQRKKDIDHSHGHGHGHSRHHGHRYRSHLKSKNETPYAIIPLSTIFFLTFSALYLCWPTDDLWYPPINHAMTFTDWKWQVPSSKTRKKVVSENSNPNTILHQINKKLSENRKLSISGKNGIGKSDAVLQYINWVSEGKKGLQIDKSAVKVSNPLPSLDGPYSVIIWLYATSPIHVAAQYVQLANYLGLRTSKLTSNMIIARVLAWLSDQPSFLLVFDNCPTKHIKLRSFDIFIPRQVNPKLEAEYGIERRQAHIQHIIFTSEIPLSKNNIKIEAFSQPLATQLLYETSKAPPSSQNQLLISQKDFTEIAKAVRVPLRLLHTGISIRVLGQRDGYTSKHQQLIEQVKKENVIIDIVQEEKIVWQLLQFISVFNKENIPYRLLQAWILHLEVEEPDKLLNSAINLLYDYKLIRHNMDSNTKKKSIFLFTIVQNAVLSSMSVRVQVHTCLQALEILGSIIPKFSPFSLGISNPDDYNAAITFSSKNPHPWLFSSMLLQHTWIISKRLGKLIPDIKELNDSYHINRILDFCSQMGHYFLKMYGEPKKARKIFQLALSLSQSELFSSQVPYNVESLLLFNMGTVSLQLKKNDKAAGYYEKAHAISVKNNDGHTAESLCYLGEVEKARGNIKQARQYFEECIRNQKSIAESRERNALLAQYFGKKAEFELSVGSQSEAINLFEYALDLEIQIFDKASEPVCARMDSLASSWVALGRKREALRMAQHSLRISKEFLDPFDPALAPRMAFVGQLHLDLAASRSPRHLRSAKRMFDSAIEIEVETASEFHPLVVERLAKSSEVEFVLGHVEESLIRCHKALGISVYLHGDDHKISQDLFIKCEEILNVIKAHNLRKQESEKKKRENKIEN